MIQDQARHTTEVGSQEFGCRTERRDRVPYNFQKQPQRIPYGGVVIDNSYRATLDRGHN
jgi:hypothetical protein